MVYVIETWRDALIRYETMALMCCFRRPAHTLSAAGGSWWTRLNGVSKHMHEWCLYNSLLALLLERMATLWDIYCSLIPRLLYTHAWEPGNKVTCRTVFMTYGRLRHEVTYPNCWDQRVFGWQKHLVKQYYWNPKQIKLRLVHGYNLRGSGNWGIQ